MKKRMLSLVLAFALMISLSSVAYTAVNVPSVKFSHSSPFAVTTAQDRLIFTLPSDDDFNYLRISLENRNAVESNILFTSRRGDNTVDYSLSGISDGTYYVQLYISPVEYGSYKSYMIGKLLTLVIKDGIAHFALAPTYEHNTLVYNTKRTDKDALAFYLKPSDGVKSDHISITALADTITRGVSGAYEKARAIHDWVCDNIWYDDDVLNDRAPYGAQSALSTLSSNRGICLGFANLTAALMRAAGIPAKVIFGYSLGVGADDEWTSESAAGKLSANHAWNEFYVNGRWVVLDTTWDTSNSYARGKYSSNTGLYYHYYFDISLEAFSSSHLIYPYSEDDIPAPIVTPPVSGPVTADPNLTQVVINGRDVYFEYYTINGENYFKLRDVMFSINGTAKQFHAEYEQATGNIALLSNTLYIPDGSEMKQGDGTAKSAIPTASAIFKDGREIELKAYTIGGNNFFRMRDIAREFNIFVEFIDGVIIVDTSRDYVSP